MKDIILVGSGGCMREIVWQIQEFHRENDRWNVLGYVDCEAPADGIGVMVGRQTIPYLGTDDMLIRQEENTNVAVCVGNPSLRRKISHKLKKNPYIQFPNLILGNATVCSDVEMGEGCIVSIDARISTNVRLGDFVFMNTGSMICHDGCVSDFVTLSPDVKLAGAVTIGQNSELGMGTKVIQGIHISENVVVGAGSIVINDIDRSCTVVGVPARKIRG